MTRYTNRTCSAENFVFRLTGLRQHGIIQSPRAIGIAGGWQQCHYP